MTFKFPLPIHLCSALAVATGLAVSGCGGGSGSTAMSGPANSASSAGSQGGSKVYGEAAHRQAMTPRDVTAGNEALYSSVPWGQAPSNGFFFLNNTFGMGNFVNGVDFESTLKARTTSFPQGSLMQWSWPDAGSGSGFAYEYPELIYGGTPYGNPYNSVGPWPQRVLDNTAFVANYDITLRGNLNSYDVLLDVYVTATPTSTDGSHVAEISFFPHMTDPNNLTGIHTFSWGRGSVFRQGQQILIRPVDASGQPMDILSGSIDMKEIFSYLISISWISGTEYLRGAEFGSEVQVPNSYNSLPHRGAMLVNKLSYDWQ